MSLIPGLIGDYLRREWESMPAMRPASPSCHETGGGRPRITGGEPSCTGGMPCPRQEQGAAAGATVAARANRAMKCVMDDRQGMSAYGCIVFWFENGPV